MRSKILKLLKTFLKLSVWSMCFNLTILADMKLFRQNDLIATNLSLTLKVYG